MWRYSFYQANLDQYVQRNRLHAEKKFFGGNFVKMELAQSNLVKNLDIDLGSIQSI